MAFTATERAGIRRALGYWERSSGYYSRLEGVMDSISAEAETLVRGWLVEIAAIDAQLSEARGCRLKAVRVEDIVLAGYDELRALYEEGNRLCRQIGVTLGIPVENYPYRSAPMSGMTGQT